MKEKLNESELKPSTPASRSAVRSVAESSVEEDEPEQNSMPAQIGIKGGKRQNRDRRRGILRFVFMFVLDLCRLGFDFAFLRLDSVLSLKRMLEYVKIFENGGGLDSDAVVPPPAAASENEHSPEKKMQGRCCYVSCREKTKLLKCFRKGGFT